MNLLITGGRVLDPKSGRDETADVLIKNGRIERIGVALPREGAQVIDATGRWVLPGLVDVHVHLRTPGQEAKETLRTGTMAAAAGGVTSVVAMGNTAPPMDTPEQVRALLDRGMQEALVHVYTVGNVTRGMAGKELADLEGMVAAGAVALSDDGLPIMNAELMRRALERARALKVPIFVHEQDADLSRGASMNEGEVARRLGHKGMPALAESTMIARDALLAETTGGHVHVQHLSAVESVRAVQFAQSCGAPLTAEACPHHFTLTDEAIELWGTAAKMNPPLRTAADRDAVLAAVLDETIEILATDHAPHTAEEKAKPFDAAPFGIVGLETLVPLVITTLIRERGMSPLAVFAGLTYRPAELVHIPAGTLAPGAPADVAIIDPDAAIVIDAARFYSKGRNTPWQGARLFGKVETTIVGGRVVYAKGQFVENIA